MTDTLIELLARALVGRVALSFLPPGELGSHRPSAWPATWAASHAIGGAAIEAARAWSALAGLATDAIGATGAAVAVALALVVRWWTLPAAMVPRHAPAAERAGVATWLLRGAWLGALLAVGLEPLACADLAAAGILVELALAWARRRPWARAAVVLAWTLALASAGAADAALAAAAAGAGWVAWRRRADARGLALAAIALASLAARDPWVATTGAGVLVAYTAAPARRRALVALAAAGLLLAVPHARALDPRASAFFETLDATFGAALETARTRVFWVAVAAALLAAALGYAGGSRAAREARAVDPPERELAGLAIAVALAPAVALGAAAALGPPSHARAAAFGAALAALAAILVGLIACPDERVERPEAR